MLLFSQCFVLVLSFLLCLFPAPLLNVDAQFLPDNGDYSILYEFTDAKMSLQPEATGLAFHPLLGSLYGYGVSSIWSCELSASPAQQTECTIKHDQSNIDSRIMTGKPLFTPSGDLYGTVRDNRGNSYLFKLNITNGFSYLWSFTTYTDAGKGITAGLTLHSDGHLYGRTNNGGTYGSGVLFRYYTSGAAEGFVQPLYSFNPNTDGSRQETELIEDQKTGKLYGCTKKEATNSAGAIFSFNPKTNNLTIIYTFTSVNKLNGLVCNQLSWWSGAPNMLVGFHYMVNVLTGEFIHLGKPAVASVGYIFNINTLVSRDTTIYFASKDTSDSYGLIESVTPWNSNVTRLHNFYGAANADGSGPINAIFDAAQSNTFYGTLANSPTAGSYGLVYKMSVSADVTAPVLPSSLGESITANVVSWPEVIGMDERSGPVTATCSHRSGDSFMSGATTITCSAADRMGNVGTATYTVTVPDNGYPYIPRPANMIVNTSSSFPTPPLSVTYPPVIAYDPQQGNLPCQCSPASGSMFNEGANTVTCTVTDSDAHTTTTQFTITVARVPIFSKIANITRIIESPQINTAVYFYINAYDDPEGYVPVTCTPASSSVFNLGDTLVTCTATDSADHVATASFYVRVRNGCVPRDKWFLNMPSTVTAVMPATNNSTFTPVTWTTVQYNSTCNIVRNATCEPSSGSTFPFGISKVRCYTASADDYSDVIYGSSFYLYVGVKGRPCVYPTYPVWNSTVPDKPNGKAACHATGTPTPDGQSCPITMRPGLYPSDYQLKPTTAYSTTIKCSGGIWVQNLDLVAQRKSCFMPVAPYPSTMDQWDIRFMRTWTDPDNCLTRTTLRYGSTCRFALKSGYKSSSSVLSCDQSDWLGDGFTWPVITRV